MDKITKTKKNKRKRKKKMKKEGIKMKEEMKEK